MQRDAGMTPGLGRFPAVGNDNPFQYSCLENSMDRGAWQVTVHGVAKSWTQPSDWTITTCLIANVNGKQKEHKITPGSHVKNSMILYIHTHTHRHTRFKLGTIKNLNISHYIHSPKIFVQKHFVQEHFWGCTAGTSELCTVRRGLTAFPLASSNQESLCFFFSLHQKYLKNINL